MGISVADKNSGATARMSSLRKNRFIVFLFYALESHFTNFLLRQMGSLNISFLIVLLSAGPEVIILFPYLTLPIVGILTFMRRINTTSERLKAINCFICWYFSFYEQLEFRAHLS